MLRFRLWELGRTDEVEVKLIGEGFSATRCGDGRNLRLAAERSILTVRLLVERFRAERMQERFSTRYGYEA